MKRTTTLITAIPLIIFLIACGSKEKAKNQEDYGTPKSEEAPKSTANDPIAEGEALVKSNDCATCHHKTNKLVGPAHLEVAKKYEFTEANVKMLATKIIQGGSGVWGQMIMNGHPDLSQQDAEKMARYVLSLDGETEK